MLGLFFSKCSASILGKEKGFTLLELIIVIIIVGVLASLALPALFKATTRARMMEAYSAISTIRRAMEECSLRHNGILDNCKLNSTDDSENTLNIDDPSEAPNAKFLYVAMGGTTPVGPYTRRWYQIFAFDLDLYNYSTRTSFDNIIFYSQEFEGAPPEVSTTYYHYGGKYYGHASGGS